MSTPDDTSCTPHTSVQDGGDGVPRGTSAAAAAAAAATALRVCRSAEPV